MPLLQGLVSYAGVVSPKGAVYTQTISVHPDKVSLRCVPQASLIPSSGTIAFEYNGSVITLPDCFLEDSRVVADVDDGFLMSLVFLDRRWKWHVAAPISGYYNVQRAGTRVAAKEKTLRQLATLLFTQMGDASADVSALSNTVYPEVRWDCEPPALALDKLLKEYGCGVTLGFGSELVKVVVIGVGASPGTSAAMMISSSMAARVRPQYCRVCYGPSLAQARFKLEPVALDTGGTWVTPASASYVPAAGWSTEDPLRLTVTEILKTEAEFNMAIKSVYRAYRIVKFADNTLNLPDGSGSIASISQCLPLFNRLLDSESIRSDGSGVPFRVYGKRLVKANEKGQPAVSYESTIDQEIVGEEIKFDGENGIIIFKNPQYYVTGGAYAFADLYLECSFGILDATGNYPYHYEKDNTIDTGGFGFHTVKMMEREARSIVHYNAGQTVGTITTNQAALDTLAGLITTSVASQYSTTASYMIVYNQPYLAVRCDGLISQVHHVISDGTQHAGSYSIVSVNFEYDRAVPSIDSRSSMLHHRKRILVRRGEESVRKRRSMADD